MSYLENYSFLFSCFANSQLDNADEQAAQVRRELDSRLHAAEEMAKVSRINDNDIFINHSVVQQKLSWRLHCSSVLQPPPFIW